MYPGSKATASIHGAKLLEELELIEVQVLRDKPVALESLYRRITKAHRVPTGGNLALRRPESAAVRAGDRSLGNDHVVGGHQIGRGDVGVR